MDEASQKQNDLWKAVSVTLLALYDPAIQFLNRLLMLSLGEKTVKQSRNRRMQYLLALIALLAYMYIK